MAIVESVWDKMECAFKEATADNNAGSPKNDTRKILNNFDTRK